MKITEEFLKERPLSFSSLKEFIKSPRHYVEYINKPRESTPDMILGSAVHKKILQPETFNDEFAIEPEIDKRTTAGKELAVKFAEESVGKQVITLKQYHIVLDMVGAFKQSPYHNLVQVEGVAEKKFEVTHSSTGLPMCGYIDKETSLYNVEIKTVQSADIADIQRDFYNRTYHLQGGIYNFANGKRILYIAIEKSPPYLCQAFFADDDYIGEGKRLFEKAIKDFRYCMDMDLFSAGYEFYAGNEPLSLSLPAWAKKV